MLEATLHTLEVTGNASAKRLDILGAVPSKCMVVRRYSFPTIMLDLDCLFSALVSIEFRLNEFVTPRMFDLRLNLACGTWKTWSA